MEFGVANVMSRSQLASHKPDGAFTKAELKADVGKSPFLNKVNVSLLSFGPRKKKGESLYDYNLKHMRCH
eukprot:12780950-Alexandrium_andersonii.AAC.1